LQPCIDYLLTNLSHVLFRTDFLNYITLVARVFSQTHSGASCANAFAHIVSKSFTAAALHNEIARLTHEEDSEFDLPEMEEDRVLCSGLKLEETNNLGQWREYVVQCIEDRLRSVKVQHADIEELLREMGGLVI
jgi:hypothetical protein